MDLVGSLLAALMVVGSVSARCPRLEEMYPECYRFPFLKDLIETKFEMGNLRKPDPIQTGLSAFLIEELSNPNETFTKRFLLRHENHIKRTYQQFVSQHKVSVE